MAELDEGMYGREETNMNQGEGGKLTREDRRELDNQIKLAEERVKNSYGEYKLDAIHELRRLRRLRYAKPEA